MKSLVLAERPDVTKTKLREVRVAKIDNHDDLYIDTITIGAHATVTDIPGNTDHYIWKSSKESTLLINFFSF